jgi:hypothetical protein
VYIAKMEGHRTIVASPGCVDSGAATKEELSGADGSGLDLNLTGRQLEFLQDGKVFGARSFAGGFAEEKQLRIVGMGIDPDGRDGFRLLNRVARLS